MHFPTIYPVACHTDNVGSGTTFVAIQGTKQDGTHYIKEALKKGANCIVVESNAQVTIETLEAMNQANAKLIRVENTRKALAELSAEKLGNPAQKLKIIGITGTKGKSTSTFLLEHTLRTMGYKTAMLSTVKNRILNTDLPTQLTTQLPDYLHVFFNECVQQDVEYVIMEVAAQAFSLYRVHGIEFSVGLFTNFSQEHFEFYASLDEYFAAKAQLIQHLKPNACLHVNSDDTWCKKLSYSNIKTFGLQKSTLQATDISTSLNGIAFTLKIDDDSYQVTAPSLMGEFNVYNCLGVLSVCHSLGLSLIDASKAIELFSSVPGRLQRFRLPNNSIGLIDFAHNPASFEAVLLALKPLTSDLIVVFGAGGDRDPVKRPMMGNIATTIADRIIVTSDNPRSEDLGTIVSEIVAGIASENMHKTHKELDREKAIRMAYALSGPESIIALLGKGPDEYELIKGEKFYFSETEILHSL